MSDSRAASRPAVDWLTVIAMAAIVMITSVTMHEGMHAAACVAFGGSVLEFSSQHVECADADFASWQIRVKAGIAPVMNIAVGLLVLAGLRRWRDRSPESSFLLWLFAAVNLFTGAGYWIFSGATGVGDWAAVIEGWQPDWLWRILIFVLGLATYSYFVWLLLTEMGQLIGGRAPELYHRANRLTLVSYVTLGGVAFLAGLFNPHGWGMMAMSALASSLGANTGLVWMMRWFKSKRIRKAPRHSLEISRRWGVILVACVFLLAFVFVLGPVVYPHG
jgi:hypothetical protein